MEKIIKELESLKLSSAEFRTGSYNEGINTALRLLKSSLPTQQDKIVVPPCVDKFLSVGNKSRKLACLVSCKYSILTCDMAEGELKQWLREVSMDDLLSLANGYIVEKEQLYEVVFHEDESDRWLLMQLGESSYEIVPESENDGYRTQWFSETEIKAINEKYWVFRHPVDEQCQSFAVPVEEEE